jgi:chemotaxis protein CheD
MSPMISIYLAPGEYFVGDARHRVHTLLGSCVSITLWQGQRRVGAMSHFLLAERGPGAPRPTAAPDARGWRVQDGRAALDARYGVEALGLMLDGLAELGVAPAECEAKIFGGGDMFPGQARNAHLNVGRRNGDAARELLRARGIPVVSHSLFGVGHRKVIFDVATGAVWSRQDDTTSNSTADLDGEPTAAKAGGLAASGSNDARPRATPPFKADP